MVPFSIITGTVFGGKLFFRAETVTVHVRHVLVARSTVGQRDIIYRGTRPVPHHGHWAILLSRPSYYPSLERWCGQGKLDAYDKLPNYLVSAEKRGKIQVHGLILISQYKIRCGGY